jgi:O2-independent ubiquinone biosynthesis protein UbiV
MQLSLAPLSYFWPRATTLAFYEAVADWPVDIVHVGETICSKRRELRTADWLGVAERLAASGKTVVLSSLALIEAESEVGALRRLVADGRFLVEANDLSAVQVCRESGRRFVGGPTLNVYNHETLRMLQEDGLQRWVPGVEVGAAQIARLRGAYVEAGWEFPALEVQVWGRQGLAYSARCFTARALDIAKDDCGFRCIEYPDGMPLATSEGEAFLRINGIQVQGDAPIDLAGSWDDLLALDVGVLRLVPQAPETTRAAVERWRGAIKHLQPPLASKDNSGFWHGAPGRGPGPLG